MIIIITISIIACKQAPNKTVEEKFGLKDFKLDTILYGEVIELPEVLNPNAYIVLNDTICLVNNRNARPYYIELYNIKTKELLSRHTKKGNGPFEFLSSHVYYPNNYSNTLFLIDVTKHIIGIFKTDSLVHQKNDYYPVIIKKPAFADIHPVLLDSTTLLTFNCYFMNNQRFSNNLETGLFCIKLDGSSDFSKHDNEYKYFTWNVSSALLAVSKEYDRVLLFYRYENRIDVFNLKLELIKTIYGPENFSPTYVLREGNHVSFDKNAYTFWSCFYTKDKVYVSYQGDYIEDRIEPIDILVFGWNGEPLERFRLDMNLGKIHLSNDEKYLYGTSYQHSYGECPKLVKYNLK